jgi:hypothetical protein
VSAACDGSVTAKNSAPGVDPHALSGLRPSYEAVPIHAHDSIRATHGVAGEEVMIAAPATTLGILSAGHPR